MAVNVDDILSFQNYEVKAAIGLIASSLSAMILGSAMPNMAVSGTRAQVNAFVGTLKSEAQYMRSIMQNGLDNARTYAHRATLDNAIKNFERETGLNWPIK
jgi:hypothetical protein